MSGWKGLMPDAAKPLMMLAGIEALLHAFPEISAMSYMDTVFAGCVTSHVSISLLYRPINNLWDVCGGIVWWYSYHHNTIISSHVDEIYGKMSLMVVQHQQYGTCL